MNAGRPSDCRDRFRAPALARRALTEIRRRLQGEWVIMEICGGHTHAILQHGIDQLLPAGIELVHGPGCPVCVTPVAKLEQAISLARRPEVLFTTFGDMLRVPAGTASLLEARADGAEVRMVYSPLEALALARRHPERQVVFFAVGFETTAPANAMAVLQAEREGLDNFSLLSSQVLVAPAIAALLAAPDNRVQGFLAPGHVCTVLGLAPYRELSDRFRVPMVVTGFEPLDLLEGILMLIRQLESGRCEVENQYRRSVRADGNPAAWRAVCQVFEVVDRPWRGLGRLAASGLDLRPEYGRFDAGRRFGLSATPGREPGRCLSGEILRGRRKPVDCPAFGRECTPAHPLGATMVSGEGACAAYYRYQPAGANG